MYLRKVSGWQAGAVLALGVAWSLQSPPSTAAPGPAGSGRPGSLEARLQRLEDKDEIHDLLIEYGRLLDDGDWVGYSQLFARQGTWTGSFGTATGPAEILAMLRKSLGAAAPHDPNQVRSFHLMTNCVIRVEGDRATATSRWTNFARTDDNKLIPRLAGHYVDVLVREDGKWKFLTRQAPRDIPNPETPAEAGKAP
jgi:3-phenylpropionate/cinnamic acid dioxygenase small subunit